MKMLGYCGIDCGGCPARKAYLEDDDDLRRETAAMWSRMYGAEISAESINCTGCRGEGIKFAHCESGCEIRKCAMPRSIANCGECTEYPCERITGFFEFVPEARANLEE